MLAFMVTLPGWVLVLTEISDGVCGFILVNTIIVQVVTENISNMQTMSGISCQVLECEGI